MFSIMIHCERTGRAVSTGIATDPVTFASMPDIDATARCPWCQTDHVWSKADAWICDRPEKAGQSRLN
jgi:hypothetical protein